MSAALLLLLMQSLLNELVYHAAGKTSRNSVCRPIGKAQIGGIAKGSVLNTGKGVGLLGWGLYSIAGSDYFTGIITGILGLVIFYMGYKDLTDTAARIIINDSGMQTASAGFARWEDIFGEQVRVETSGKTTTTYLIYQHPKGSEKLDIGELQTSAGILTHLLTVYRGRSRQRRKTYRLFFRVRRGIMRRVKYPNNLSLTITGGVDK